MIFVQFLWKKTTFFWVEQTKYRFSNFVIFSILSKSNQVLEKKSFAEKILFSFFSLRISSEIEHLNYTYKTLDEEKSLSKFESAWNYLKIVRLDLVDRWRERESKSFKAISSLEVKRCFYSDKHSSKKSIFRRGNSGLKKEPILTNFVFTHAHC